MYADDANMRIICIFVDLHKIRIIRIIIKYLFIPNTFGL